VRLSLWGLRANVVLFVASLLALVTDDPQVGVVGWLLAMAFAVLNILIVVALGRRRVGRCREAAWGLLGIGVVLTALLASMIPNQN
jgi:hypothetical protein